MQAKKVLRRAGLTGVVLAAVTSCSVPSGEFTQVQHDLRGNVIHCTYQKYFHPDIPFTGRGWWEHKLVGGPSSCLY